MARRIRTIKPEMLEDEKVATLPHDTWRLFVSAILLADDYGNFRASPKQIDGAVFWAFDDAEVPRMLRQLGERDLLRFYTVRGQRYAHITKWEKHQKVDHPGKPGCPGPSEAEPEAGAGDSAELRATDSPPSREDLANPSRLTGTGIRTGIRTEDQDQEREPPAPARDPTPPAPAPEPPPVRVTGYDLTRAYGEERSLATDGKSEPWRTPSSRDGKAETFAATLTPEEARDVRPTMKLHFADLKAGKGKLGALDSPGLGFACWMTEFTALRERLRGKSFGPRPAGAAARASPAPAADPGICGFHTQAKHAEKQAPRHDQACSECRHVAARNRPRTETEPTAVGDLMQRGAP